MGKERAEHLRLSEQVEGRNLRLAACALLIGLAAWLNVRMVTLRPNQSVFRLPEGELRSDFECGSVGEVSEDPPGRFNVQPAIDFPGAREGQDWVFFRFTPRVAEGLFRFRLGPLTHQGTNIVPFWRTEASSDFRPLQVFSFEARGKKRFLLFEVDFSREQHGRFTEFATDRPLSPYALLEEVAALRLPSLAGLRLQTLFEPLPAIRLRGSGEARPVVVLLARLRPQDTISGHLVQALTAELVESGVQGTTWIVPCADPVAAIHGNAAYTEEAVDISSRAEITRQSLHLGSLLPLVDLLHRIADEARVESLVVLEGGREVGEVSAQGSRKLLGLLGFPPSKTPKDSVSSYFCKAAAAQQCLHVRIPATLGLEITEVSQSVVVADGGLRPLADLARRLSAALNTFHA